MSSVGNRLSLDSSPARINNAETLRKNDSRAQGMTDISQVSRCESARIHSQSLLHVRKRETLRLASKVIQQTIGEFDPIVVLQLVLPVQRVLTTFMLDGIGEVAMCSRESAEVVKWIERRVPKNSLLSIKPGRTVRQGRVETIKVVGRGQLRMAHTRVSSESSLVPRHETCHQQPIVILQTIHLV